MKYTVLCIVFGALLLGGCMGHPSSLRDEGIEQFQTGHIAKARETFRTVLSRWPSDAESLYYMGRIVHADGHYLEAIYYYQCCLDAKPSHADARQWLAKAQADAGPGAEKIRYVP